MDLAFIVDCVIIPPQYQGNNVWKIYALRFGISI